ncbi:uncharacterized protein AC631_04397 [Debaryomyces fabryi]|uniref:Uncharacterized protein n=1 Tax=Debaryomyces fabryi TaxID=58627 RepID=A0A0V1PUD2_9ASCO|nr:uncharacterized protein AC631_04397 [Debaryomyces fabryi]KRZ99840.1 hypothetical protein AC631_04397 [Debaryomyces fabryi]CUM56611.1 unnamed protein product [Debaryomyces fabryi]
MGYPNPLKTVSRSLTDNIVITSCGFSCVKVFNFGARMSLIKYGDEIIVWSPIPYGDEVIKALNLLTGNSSGVFNIAYLIIPNNEHNLAAKSFKANYPNIKIIALESIDLGLECPIDYRFTKDIGNTLVDQSVLSEKVGILSPAILNNLEFVYLLNSANKDLVMFDKNSKIMFEADILVNLGIPGSTSGKATLEQYSTLTGYPDNFLPHFGLSFFTRYLQPYSKVGNWLVSRIANSANPNSQKGLKAIYDWDFEQIVMCHGNVIDRNAKLTFQNVYQSVLG